MAFLGTTKVIGLTGGIASGKSTVARILSELGFPCLDADELVRELSAPGGKAYDAIVKRFGTADRGTLREVVFDDVQARHDLEAILHPLVRLETIARAAKVIKFGLPLIYEAALLVETGRYRELDGLIVVNATEQLRRERLRQRNQWDELMIDRVIAAQARDEVRLAAATVVFTNNGTEEDLRTQVETWASPFLE
jgi:dephospho-CoA kinase